MTLGQRVLQARLAAGLSQRELAGEEITRNMLSSLEHDAATPSIATLRYLARRLGRPVSYFFGEDASEGIAAFEAGAWHRSLELMTQAERRWLEPLALLREAELAVGSGRICQARELLQRLEGLSSPLFGPELRRKAAMLRCRCGVCTDIPEDNALLIKAELALAERRFPDAERYLLARDHRDAHWHHLMGECRFHTEDYAAARDHYHHCETDFDVRQRLETCYRKLQNFRMACFYAKKG